MKIEQNYLDDHQLEVTVETDLEGFEQAKRKAARELAKGKKIPGYRPGKAPYQLILNHFGEAAVIDRALDGFLDQVYPQIIDEIDFEPYGPGQVQEIKTLDPPTFLFMIPLQPEVNLGDYREIRIPFEAGEVQEEDVDEFLDRLRAQQAAVEPVDHPAEEGNLVDTTLDGRPVDSDPDQDESYLLRNQPLPVMVKTQDEDSSKEWPFPGFSRQLLGASAGDVLELSHQFSDQESVDEDYRGKEILYTVNIQGVRERVLPDLDDEFVASVSELETVAQLREEIREDLEKQREVEDSNSYINQILDKILESSQIKYPPQMLENEIEGEISELEERLKAQGMDLELYLSMQDLDLEGLKEQLRPNAEKRIAQGLVIGRISESEELDINPEDITSEFQSILDEHFGDDTQSRTEYMNSRESVALLNRVSSQMITNKTLEFLKAVAQGEDLSPYLKPDPDDASVEEEQPAEAEGDETSAEDPELDPVLEEPNQNTGEDS